MLSAVAYINNTNDRLRPFRTIMKDYNLCTLFSPTATEININNIAEVYFTESISLEKLIDFNLKAPINIRVKPDEDGYIAESVNLPLYGCAATRNDAIEMLKREIESLYNDLSEDDNFTDDWLRVKRYLQSLIEA